MNRPCVCRWLARLVWLLGASLVLPGFAKEHWTKVSTPYQTILTEDSVSDAKAWAACLEVFHRHLQSLAPTDNRMLDPMTMVIFKSEKAYRATMRPNQKDEGLGFSASSFMTKDGRFLGGVNPRDSDIARYSVFMQSSLWLTASYRWPLPLWLVSGLQYVYADYSVSGNHMEIGGDEEAFAQSLRGGPYFPVDQMLGMTTSSKLYQAKDEHFNAQAWAFVHYLMFSEKGANRARLAQYMQAIQRGESEEKSEELLAPNGLDDLSARFTRYVRNGVYRMESIPIDLAEVRTHVTVAPASELEVKIALGYLSLHYQGVAAATPYFDRAAELAPQSVQTLEALAELAHIRNDQIERDRLYSEAVKAGSTFYLAHYYQLYPSIQAMAGAEAAQDGTDPAEARKAFEGVKVLLRLRPGFLTAHQTLALLAGALHEVNDDDGAVLREGEKLYPRDAMIITGVAAYEIAKKRLVSAKKELERLRNEDLENTNNAGFYANKLASRMESANNLMWLDKYYADGDFVNADKIVSDPAALRRLLPAEREHASAIRSYLGGREILALATKAAGRKEWDGADSLLSQVEYMKLDGEVGKEAAALRATIDEGRKAAKAR